MKPPLAMGWKPSGRTGWKPVSRGISRLGLTCAGQGVGVGFLTGSPGRGGVWVVLFQGEGFKEFNDGTEEDHQRDDAIGDEEHLVEAFGEAITVEAYAEEIDVPP